jgi:hypothetical protein
LAAAAREMNMSPGGYANAFRSVLKKLRDGNMYIDGGDGDGAGAVNSKPTAASPRKRTKVTPNSDDDEETPKKRRKTKKEEIKKEEKDDDDVDVEVEFEA